MRDGGSGMEVINHQYHSSLQELLLSCSGSTHPMSHFWVMLGLVYITVYSMT